MRAMREEAEALLDTAKDYRDGAKNAVNLFGVSAHWDQARDLLALGKWLAGLCEEGRITRGLLRRLLGYARECKEFLNGRRLAQNGLYASHFSYDLARNWKGDEDDPDRIRLQALVHDKERFTQAEMAICWAIYRTRIST